MNLFLSDITINYDEEIRICSTAIYEITTKRNKVEIKSTVAEVEKVLEFKDVVKQVCATNDACYVLLQDGTMFCYNFVELTLKEIPANDSVSDIACTNDALYCINALNHLHQTTPDSNKKIFEFPPHQKVRKIVSGAEHLLLLTSNGDVFSFGCGLRGALGHGDVGSCESPKQLDALAGLKIVDISAGLFHSVAVSSFGDVYSWGWNTSGQLGLPKVAQKSFKKASESRQQVFTIPQLIELEDDNETIKNVYCGSRHTILRTERNRLFVTGLNNYGQLGLSSQVEDIDKFTEMPVDNVNETTKVACGFWSTYLIDFK